MLHAQFHQSPTQLPLIHTIDEDDQLLLNSPDAQWYRILKYFPDMDYRQIATDYYNSLYHFNKTRTMDRGDQHVNDEDKADRNPRANGPRNYSGSDRRQKAQVLFWHV